MKPHEFKNHRLLLGWTIERCAKALRCNARTVRRYEQPVEQKGHRSVPRRVADDMSRWLKQKEVANGPN